MYSKAHILLKRDFNELEHSVRKGITAFPASDDMMSWKAEIEGLPDSVCEGLVFHLTLDFSQEYNLVPPVVKFVTIPFHPNVDPYTGKPSIDILDKPDKWKTSYTVYSILLDLQMLLSYPILKNPVNLEAAQLLIKDESTYKIVLQELLPSASPKRVGSLVLAEKPQERVRIVKTISFNDYYKTWSEIATTKVAEHSKNPFAGDPHFVGQYYKWKQQYWQYRSQWESKFVLSKWQTARKKVMAQDKSEPYDEGTVIYPSPSKLDSAWVSTIYTVSAFQQCYLFQMEMSSLIEVTELSLDNEIEGKSEFYELPQEWPEESLPDEHDSKESWEEEVDNLVTWSNGLDEDSLNYEDYESGENYETVGN
ncbi:ubiquitin-conjugating enzyme E2 U [Apodemus sylvaticus]|uniref:ubiquitin-conjugating enzyme E2 U n=1 Tax=Apodemus sylvaticus TaxID=10129 RepID=UPI002244748E|nr:ubiquitin-conjugating enzyme E2 U [Apodemus sylvaticus]